MRCVYFAGRIYSVEPTENLRLKNRRMDELWPANVLGGPCVNASGSSAISDVVIMNDENELRVGPRRLPPKPKCLCSPWWGWGANSVISLDRRANGDGKECSPSDSRWQWDADPSDSRFDARVSICELDLLVRLQQSNVYVYVVGVRILVGIIISYTDQQFLEDS